MAYDPEVPQANQEGTILEAVTKDQLNIGLTARFASASPSATCMPTCSA